MSLVSRELSITYAGYKVGGDQTARILRDWHMVEQSYETATVEYRFTLVQATAALLAAAISEVEAIFRTPQQALTIMQDSQTFKSFSHTNSTGFDGLPTITKRGEPTDTGRSRTYTVRIEFQLPADTSGSGYRRITKTAVNVAYSPARRRTLTISGQYTASGSTAARDVYEGAIAGYAASVQSALGGTWKLLEEPTTSSNDSDKVIDFTILYEEIIFTGVGASNVNIRKEAMTIGRNKVGPGDSPDGGPAKRFVTLNVNYECWLDNTASTNLRGLYTSIRPLILSQVRATLEGGAIAVMDENPTFDPVENKLNVSMVCFGASGSNIIENKVTTENHIEHGLVQVPAWAGDPLARYIFPGPRTERKTVTIQQRVFGRAGNGGGGAGPAGGGNGPGGVGLNAQLVGAGVGVAAGFNIGGQSFPIFGGPMTGAQQTALVNAVMRDDFGQGGGGGGGGGGGPAAQVGGDTWIPISNTHTKTPLRLGIEPDTFDVEDVTIVTVVEKVKPIKASGGGGPGATVAAASGGR